MNRRKLIQQLAVGSLAIPSLVDVYAKNQTIKMPQNKLKGNINHSVCRWTYKFLNIEELCVLVKKIGFSAIDLVEPKDFPILKKYDIYSSMCTGAHISLKDGWNNTKNHPILIDNYLKHIDIIADAGYKNLICFSGNKEGMFDEEGIKNCVIGLKQILAKAEKRGVVIHMELLNSKKDHNDYMADNSSWGVRLCNELNSDYFKLLYDIYHMQIMEGDIIKTIQDNYKYIGHYHTGGVPGRNEIDDTQELFYPAIMKAIVATGYKGYVAQEFKPKAMDKLMSLEKSVLICDV